MSDDLIYAFCRNVYESIMPRDYTESGGFELDGDDITYKFSYYGDVSRTDGDYFIPPTYYLTVVIRSIRFFRNGEEIKVSAEDKAKIESELNSML